VVEGTVTCEGRTFASGTLFVLRARTKEHVGATDPARVMIVGGAKLDGERHIWWNFVSSTKERIERAKDDWRERRFAPVAGDEGELVALPER
jgi:redox-sensitive bicupin YhaK (pirin superfamily)